MLVTCGPVEEDGGNEQFPRLPEQLLLHQSMRRHGGHKVRILQVLVALPGRGRGGCAGVNGRCRGGEIGTGFCGGCRLCVSLLLSFCAAEDRVHVR